jgi:AcrR family transcriptional regulator
MRDELGLAGQSSVLTPTLPTDIGSRSQRKRILDAMADSCAAKSFSATTIADVVGRASISRATFYKHFANKRECFDAAVEDFFVELAEAAEESQSGAGWPGPLFETIGAVLDLLAANPSYAQLLALEAPILDPGAIVQCRERAVAALAEQWGGNKMSNGAKADPRVALGRAHVLVADLVAAGEAELLPSLRPDIAYALLLPFVGRRKALAELELAR